MSEQRVSVQTYVSGHQRDIWRREADELDVSQAEYVRMMIQAGRRSFDLEESSDHSTDEATSPDATPGVDGLKEGILDVLREREYADWEELLTTLTDDVEERLEDSLEELQSADRIQHSGRHGGYTMVDDGR